MTKKKKNNDPKQLNPIPWIAGAVLVLGLVVLGGIYWDRTGKVKEIRFEGYEYISLEKLQQQTDIPTGVHPDSLDLTGFISQYEEIDYVKQAGISMEPGGNLTVTITERQPIALLVQGEYRAYVDADGIRLKRILGKTPGVPILYGFDAKPATDTLKSEAFKITSRFLQELQKRPASDATVSEVAWSDEEGVIALTNENGVRLTFGKGEFDKRLRNWEAFYSEVVRQKGISNMQSVDLRFEGQIVTRENK